MKPLTWLLRLQRMWILLLIFLIPLSLKYITKEPFAISWLNVLSVGFIGLTVLNILLGNLRLRLPGHRPFVLLIALFFASMVLALFFTSPFRDAVGLWTSRLLQPFLVGYGLFLLLEKRAITAREIFGAFFFSLIPLLVMGLMQYLGYIEYRDPGRITATYFYPNTFARYVLILLLVSLPSIFFSGQKRPWVWFGVWLLGVILLLSSQSYNGTVSFFFGVGTFLFLLPTVFAPLKRIGLIAMILVAAVVALNAPKLPKWQVSITDSRLTRLEFWQVATGKIKENFFTGIGIKTWEQEYPNFVLDYVPFPPRNWGSVQPHNVFLDSFLKAGILGFFAITSLLLWPILEGWRYAKSTQEKHGAWWVGAALAMYGVALLTFGFIDDPLWSDDTVPVLFIVYFTLAYYVGSVKKIRAKAASE